MKPVWKVVGWVGGAVGAVVAGAAVAQTAKVSHERKNATDRLADEPLGQLRPDRESTVAAEDGVPISVEEVDPADGGEPDIAVVLVHGFALDRRCFHFQRRDLAELIDPRVHQVLYDQRGHGRSGKSSAENSTIDQLALDLDSVIRAVVPEGPLVLVGHSMGGMTIMALAEKHPELFEDRVRGVALIGTAAGAVGGAGLPKSVLSRYNLVTLGVGRLAGIQPGFVEWVRKGTKTLTWSGIRALAFGDRKVAPSLVDLMEQMINGTRVLVLTEFLETLGTHDRYKALAGLRHCEVLILSGDADKLTPFSHAARMAEEMPHATLVRAPGAGHMVMMEQADLVNDHLVALVERCATDRGESRKKWWRRA
ncbi:alpha/beta fold hydrolase [Lentzea flaviverrucosa]|uniref:Pimeloyl-ACP methyl ester carboxylesterase n=1 Tax=Lentzea flaviverrucosa TaxID=200379 RepID=A0A1H9XYI8_9PSEU|nr:alpha/beta hydrolase [Lentzea flaviverrucosa]RDI30182.1 pimeloyl-ACP methyl ester carboxylesterase [Lentzea flaviverrucosa]SES51171.1 Pimeloyl-ACP methyl ester carboxylesterase [Lentzea flaviverrucosa]